MESNHGIVIRAQNFTGILQFQQLIDKMTVNSQRPMQDKILGVAIRQFRARVMPRSLLGPVSY
jgi:hypothetical protein